MAMFPYDQALATATRNPPQSIADVLATMQTIGIPRGLRTEIEAKREPVEVDASPPLRVDTSWEVLMDAGLQLLCEWTLDSERIIKLEERTNCM
jgi:hypothetical protein